MVATDGHLNKQSVTIAIDEILLSNKITDALNADGYHLVTINFDDDIAGLLSSHSFDAIVTAAQRSAVRALKQLAPQYRRDLLLLIMPQETPIRLSEDLIELVDVVLPMSPELAIKQVRLLIHLHLQNKRQQARIADLESDLSAQKRATSEIEVLKNAIVRNVSHELRTPLLQVKSAVSLIKEDLTDHRLINYAENATARLESHVTNITMLGHSLDINIGALILRDAVYGARRNLARIWQRRDQTDRITLDLEDNLPPVLADKQGLSVVLQLLMDNALKFSDDRVDVIGRRQGDIVYVAVRDFGIGIAKDKLQTIFESFYQVDSSDTRRFGGAGVGLALVKLILDHHEVQINVNSTLDEGSTFWFNLPYVDMDDSSHNQGDD